MMPDATLLVVDDDEQVRRFCRECLTLAGFRVCEADNGFDALLIGASQDGAVDLLITDMEMPRIRGPELAAAFQALWPSTMVLFISGSFQESDREAFGANISCLSKPFGLRRLVETVHGMLAGSEATIFQTTGKIG